MFHTKSRSRKSGNARFTLESLENRTLFAADVVGLDVIGHTADLTPRVELNTEMRASGNQGAVQASHEVRKLEETSRNACQLAPSDPFRANFESIEPSGNSSWRLPSKMLEPTAYELPSQATQRIDVGLVDHYFANDPT